MKIKPDTKVQKAIRLLIDADKRLKLTELEEIMYSVVDLELASNFSL